MIPERPGRRLTAPPRPRAPTRRSKCCARNSSTARALRRALGLAPRGLLGLALPPPLLLRALLLLLLALLLLLLVLRAAALRRALLALAAPRRASFSSSARSASAASCARCCAAAAAAASRAAAASLCAASPPLEPRFARAAASAARSRRASRAPEKNGAGGPGKGRPLRFGRLRPNAARVARARARARRARARARRASRASRIVSSGARGSARSHSFMFPPSFAQSSRCVRTIAWPSPSSGSTSTLAISPRARSLSHALITPRIQPRPCTRTCFARRERERARARERASRGGEEEK